MKKKYKVAAVQASPVFLDLEASVEKACGIIEEAAQNGAELVALPEAFFPGYPYWIWVGDPGAQLGEFWIRFHQNTVEIPGPAVSRLSDAARKNNIVVCASVTERDGGSLYLTQLWFDKAGNLMGKHRKLRPTNAERIVWGDGDGSMMPVFDTELGRLGGLQCWEHMMPANAVVMASMNEQVHVAAYPAFAWDQNSIFAADCCHTTTKYYAMATGTYVLLASEPLSQETCDAICGDDAYKRGIYKPGYGAGARIISPAGLVIGEYADPHSEGIAYAEIDLDETIMAKARIDIAGHYSKGNVVSVRFNKTAQKAVSPMGEDADYSIPYEELHTK